MMVKTVTLDHINKRRPMPADFGPTTQQDLVSAEGPPPVPVEPVADTAMTARERGIQDREEAADVVDALLTAGLRQGVPASVLDAHGYVAHKIRSTRSTRLATAIPKWYERYYRVTLRRPAAIAKVRTSERLRELRYAVTYRDFPRSDGAW